MYDIYNRNNPYEKNFIGPHWCDPKSSTYIKPSEINWAEGYEYICKQFNFEHTPVLPGIPPQLCDATNRNNEYFQSGRPANSAHVIWLDPTGEPLDCAENRYSSNTMTSPVFTPPRRTNNVDENSNYTQALKRQRLSSNSASHHNTTSGSPYHNNNLHSTEDITNAESASNSNTKQVAETSFQVMKFSSYIQSMKQKHPNMSPEELRDLLKLTGEAVWVLH